ncbi:hypothetical protein TNCV_3947341, partial [Trichonephila clavipes]
RSSIDTAQIRRNERLKLFSVEYAQGQFKDKYGFRSRNLRQSVDNDG